MSLPYSFLLGLVVLLAPWESLWGLPREPDVVGTLPFLFLIPVPGLFMWVLSRRPRFARRGANRRLRLLGLVQVMLVPGVFALLLGAGDFALLAHFWSFGFATVATLLKLLPLLIMEFSVERVLRRASRSPVAGLPLGPTPFHGNLIGFVTIMVLISTVGLDVLSLSREMEVFVVFTNLGQTVGLLLFFGILCLALPFLFYLFTPSSGDVPEDTARTAELLGFPRDRIRILHSDNRLINAMLVGPLPGMRYLFLTDGLVSLLDTISLRGVVAHEIGHARAGHPMLLLVLVALIPLLLLQPLEVVGVFELDLSYQLCVFGFLLIAGVALAKRIAHRFELEADQLSSEALGGAAPCILALQKVGALAGGSPTRSSFRHPSEETRIQHLLVCDGDPWFRERFSRQNKNLRRGIAAGVLVALALSVWGHARVWSVDRLVLEFYTGRFAAAAATLAELPAELPPGREGVVSELREEIAVARSFYPDGGDWREIREDLATRAQARGRREFVASGPVVARPWMALGMAQSAPSAKEISLYLFCDAVADGHNERAEELRQHMLSTFEFDEALRAVLARGQLASKSR